MCPSESGDWLDDGVSFAPDDDWSLEQPHTPITSEAQALVGRLSSGGMYVRTGILQLSEDWVGREAEVAVRLGAEYVSYQEWKVSQLQPMQSFLLLSAQRLIDELDQLCVQYTMRDTLLVSLLDLPLSQLPAAERTKFWQFMHGGFSKRPRALLLALPEQAAAALPSDPEALSLIHI